MHLAVLLALACASCGSRTGLDDFVNDRDASADEPATAANEADASAEPRADAGAETSLDASMATCSTPTGDIFAGCDFGFRWTCGNQTYGASGDCAGGAITIQCRVDGKAVGKPFVVSTPTCPCNDLDTLAAIVGAHCVPGGDP